MSEQEEQDVKLAIDRLHLCLRAWKAERTEENTVNLMLALGNVQRLGYKPIIFRTQMTGVAIINSHFVMQQIDQYSAPLVEAAHA